MIHELSGKRLSCHCRQNEKCHAENLQDLFRELHPHAFDPSSSERPPLSSGLNILAKAREDRENSEESGLAEAEANAPHGWQGTGKPMVIGSVYVAWRLCDGEGPCSPGAWAPKAQKYPCSSLWKELVCSSGQLSPFLQSSSCLMSSRWVVTESHRSERA